MMSLFTRLLPSVDHRDRRTRARMPAHRRAILSIDRLEDRQLLSTPTTFTVTNLNDSGTGSLRAAITQADQAGGNNVIDFTVTGTVTLNSALPER